MFILRDASNLALVCRQQKNGIGKRDRVKLMEDIKKLAYMENEDQANETYDELVKSSLWGKYPNFISYAEEYMWNHREDWCCSYRK